MSAAEVEQDDGDVIVPSGIVGRWTLTLRNRIDGNDVADVPLRATSASPSKGVTSSGTDPTVFRDARGFCIHYDSGRVVIYPWEQIQRAEYETGRRPPS